MRVMYGVQAVYGVHCVPLQMGFLLVRVARASAGDSVFFFLLLLFTREREKGETAKVLLTGEGTLA